MCTVTSARKKIKNSASESKKHNIPPLRLAQMLQRVAEGQRILESPQEWKIGDEERLELAYRDLKILCRATKSDGWLAFKILKICGVIPSAEELTELLG